MVIVKTWGSFSSYISEAVTSSVTWTAGACSSIKDTASDLRQRVHHVARNILLTSIGWFNSTKKTTLMTHVQTMGGQSYALFGSREKKAFEICSMISALSARLLIAEEKKHPLSAGIIAKTHGILLSSLIWLEGKEPSTPIPQSIQAITEKIGELWKKKQTEYLNLDNECGNASVQADMDQQA